MGAPIVTKYGARDMQVCVSADMSDEQVKAWADEAHPSDTKQGWTIRRTDDKALSGDPKRVKCLDDANYVHIMLDA